MRNVPTVLTVAFLATALSISVWNAKADRTSPEAAAFEANHEENVEVRLARAHLELAKLDWRRIKDWDRLTPHRVAKPLLDKLWLHVEIDDEQLEQCLRGADADSHQICIRSAKARVKIAEADLKRKRSRYQQLSTTSNAFEFKRAGVVVKLAKLNLERIQDLEKSESVLLHLQWQIDELRHQVADLQMQLATKFPRNN